MKREQFIDIINGLDIKTIEGFYLKITNSDNVRGQIEQGLDCIDLEESVNEAIEYIESYGKLTALWECDKKNLLDILRGEDND